jgi:hypothetical protein
MIKNLLIVALVIGVGYWAFYNYGAKMFGGSGEQYGVKVGEAREDVDAALGPPFSQLPNFGRDLCRYHTKDGKTIVIIFESGKVDEIHDE